MSRKFEKELKQLINKSLMDDFGQTVTIGQPPTHYLSYEECIDVYVGEEWVEVDADIYWDDVLESLDDDGMDVLLNGWECLMEWANAKYPNSMSCVGDSYCEDGEKHTWFCCTYNPKYSDSQIFEIIKEYLAENTDW